jgi:DNA-directed RNA polymerase specialized sigma24 family protein
MGLDKKQTEYIEALYREMFPRLLTYAQCSLQDAELAEEAVQDAFRIACARPDAVISSENPPGWMMNTLKYVIRNLRRSRARLSALVADYMAFDEENFAAEPPDDAGFQLEELLGSGDFKLLKRIVLQKYSMLEAARELGISVDACKKRVQRARKKLQKIYENAGPDVPKSH